MRLWNENVRMRLIKWDCENDLFVGCLRCVIKNNKNKMRMWNEKMRMIYLLAVCVVWLKNNNTNYPSTTYRLPSSINNLSSTINHHLTNHHLTLIIQFEMQFYKRSKKRERWERDSWWDEIRDDQIHILKLIYENNLIYHHISHLISFTKTLKYNQHIFPHQTR